MSLGFAFTHANLTDEISIAHWIHEGWRQNYRFWRENQPWLNGSYSKPLRNEERDLSLSLDYKDLSAEEQEKDLVIARAVLRYM